MKRTNTPFIIEGTVTYVPRITGYDKYDRHSITIIPDDQSIIEQLNDKRYELLEFRAMKHDIPADATPVKESWKIIPSHEQYGITINWINKEIAEGDVVIFDEDEVPYEGKYSDQQLQKARVKCSFELWSYCFNTNDGSLKYGTKIKLRKLKLLKIASINELFSNEHHESVNTPVVADF